MELFKIVKDSNKSLRERSIDISFPLTKEIIELGNNMLTYLKLSQDEEFLAKHKKIRSGVGLAAPQVGKNIKMLAVYFAFENKEYEYILINPKILSESTKECYLTSGEGCLSVDNDHKGYVYRPYKIKVQAYNLVKNEFVTLDLKGYPAIVLQHEIDHLKGVLFYDHINKEDPFIEKKGAIPL